MVTKLFLTNPASRHMNHMALPRALPFAIPSPPQRLAALLQLPPPLTALKSFEAHMWADGLISHHARAVSACHKCSVDDRSPQNELRPRLPADTSCFDCVLPGSVCISVS